jgi:hypothetical protein
VPGVLRAGLNTVPPQPLEAVRNKSLSDPGGTSPAGSKAIGPAPEKSLRGRKGFVADSPNSKDYVRQPSRSSFDHGEVTDPGAPGNHLTIDGKRAGIERLTVASGTPALDLVISQAGTAPAVDQESPSGFTYDEELFRTKWGWAAFEQVRRAGREEPSAPHHP